MITQSNNKKTASKHQDDQISETAKPHNIFSWYAMSGSEGT